MSAFRYDSNFTQAATNVPIGAAAPLYIVPFALVTVMNGNSLALLYLDAGLTQQIEQPVMCDASGRFGFWLNAAGNYTYTATNLAGSPIGGTYYIPGAGSSLVIQAGTGITITGSGTTGSPMIISASGASTSLTITTFEGGETVEVGTTVTNPAFTATYSGTPISASITNTDNIGSPQNLTSPYTSATVTGNFAHSTETVTTFTLHASDGANSPTATETISWLRAIFSGAGSAGATASVTASGTTAVLSNGTVLPRFQLGAEAVGTVFTFTGLSNQVAYLLLTGPSHTFIDANTGFPFAVNAPIAVLFVNAHGDTVSMYLYASTNALYGNYSPKVAS